MYLVLNKKKKQTLPQMYPSFIIDGLIQKGKRNKHISVRQLPDGYEIKTNYIWIEVKPIEFLSFRGHLPTRTPFG